jgi:hypothetical protein
MFYNNIIMTMIIIYCDAVSVWTGGRRGRPKRKGYIFHSPLKGSRTAEAFQSLFTHTDGKIRDGYGRKLW